MVDVGGWLAELAIALLAILILADVATRALFRTGVPWALEFSEYLFVAAVYLGFGAALLDGTHVLVDTLVVRLRSSWRTRLAVITSVLAAPYVGVLLWQGLRIVDLSLRQSRISEYPTQIPLLLPQLVIPAGAALLLVALCVRLGRLIRGTPEPVTFERHPIGALDDVGATTPAVHRGAAEEARG